MAALFGDEVRSWPSPPETVRSILTNRPLPPFPMPRRFLNFTIQHEEIFIFPSSYVNLVTFIIKSSVKFRIRKYCQNGTLFVPKALPAILAVFKEQGTIYVTYKISYLGT